MMLLKRILLASILFQSLSKMSAQDYLPVRDSTSAFFIGNQGKIAAVRIDSTKTDGISKVIYLNHTWNTGNYLCITPTGPSFLGTKCIIKDSEIFAVLNSKFDSVFIHYNNALNSPWLMYRFSDSSYYEANISKKELKSFQNIEDSVETIEFQLKAKTGDVISDYQNFPQIEITKNYGLLSSPGFNEFPGNLSIYKLIGLTHPKIGRTFLTDREIFNYDLNDEFHYETAYSNPPNGTGSFSNEIRILIRKHISENTDTIIYSFKRIGKYENVDWSTNIHTTNYKTDTLTELYEFGNLPFYYLPDEAITDRSQYYTSYSLVLDSITNRRLFTPSSSNFVESDSSCWSQLVDGGGAALSYKEGCGIVYDNNDMWPGQNHSNLVYYKKGSETWGVPLVIDNLPMNLMKSINVFPNPLHTGELLNVELPSEGPSLIQIFNLPGLKMIDLNFSSAGIKTISTESLMPGTYIVNVVCNEQFFYRAKLIVF